MSNNGHGVGTPFSDLDRVRRDGVAMHEETISKRNCQGGGCEIEIAGSIFEGGKSCRIEEKYFGAEDGFVLCSSLQSFEFKLLGRQVQSSAVQSGRSKRLRSCQLTSG